MKKKRPGSSVLVVAFALCIITIIIGTATARISNNLLGSMSAGNINVQAHEYAQDKAEIIKASTYDEVTTENKTLLQDNSRYSEEVIIKNDTRQKDVTINIYYDQETDPRASVNLTRSLDANTGCPVGTIIAWPSATMPKDGGVWLRCNGSLIPSPYTSLRQLLGSDRTPTSPVGSFLRGHGTYDADHTSGNLLEWQNDSTFKIEGSFYTFPPQFIAHFGSATITWKTGPWNSGQWDEKNVHPSGLFTNGGHPRFVTKFDRQDGTAFDNATYKYPIAFDNSRAIRTSSETRPFNVAVYFLIKAQ